MKLTAGSDSCFQLLASLEALQVVVKDITDYANLKKLLKNLRRGFVFFGSASKPCLQTVTRVKHHFLNL